MWGFSMFIVFDVRSSWTYSKCLFEICKMNLSIIFWFAWLAEVRWYDMIWYYMIEYLLVGWLELHISFGFLFLYHNLRCWIHHVSIDGFISELCQGVREPLEFFRSSGLCRLRNGATSASLKWIYCEEERWYSVSKRNTALYDWRFVALAREYQVCYLWMSEPKATGAFLFFSFRFSDITESWSQKWV